MVKTEQGKKGFQPLFSEDERKLVYEFAPGKTRNELLSFCQEELGRSDVTFAQIRSYTTNHPDLWKTMARDSNKLLLNEEQTQFAFQFAPGRSNHALMEALNEKFDLDLNIDQVCGWTKRRPWLRQTMVKWQNDKDVDMEEKQVGSHMAQRVPIGSIRKTKNGVLVKVVDHPDKNIAFKSVSRMVWENAHGFTDKHICHLDGNVFNDSLDNLVAVSMAAKYYMMHNKLWKYDDPELTRSRLLMAELAVKTRKLEREARK